MIDSIKVAGNVYTIRADQDLENQGILGEANFNTHEILINPLYSKQQQEAVLLHEIIHVINYVYNVGLDEEHVDRLARGLYATIVENPNYKIKEI